MTATALLIVLTFGGFPATPAQAGGPTTDAGKVALVRQNLDTLELAARQAKTKGASDPQALAALEKQYAEVSAAVEGWRTAAVSPTEKDSASSAKRVEDLSPTTARAVVAFGRDARRYATGQAGAVNPRVAAGVETRFVDAAQALARNDEQTRQKLAADLSCRSWAELRLPNHGTARWQGPGRRGQWRLRRRHAMLL